LLGARALKRHQKRLGTYQQTAIRAASTGSSSSLRCALHNAKKLQTEVQRGTHTPFGILDGVQRWLFLEPGLDTTDSAAALVASPPLNFASQDISLSALRGEWECNMFWGGGR
jgi:hypothetical protein